MAAEPAALRADAAIIELRGVHKVYDAGDNAVHALRGRIPATFPLIVAGVAVAWGAFVASHIHGRFEWHHLAEGLRAGASAAASGSAFTFIGRLRAVLITYPDEDQMDHIWREAA